MDCKLSDLKEKDCFLISQGLKVDENKDVDCPN
jgi:hypothetical protein